MLDLLTIAQECRRRIEAVALPGSHVAFSMFPNGACGATSDLLARLLVERHGFDAKVASGTNVDQWSHAWVVVDGVVIDITGDQFEGRPSVFVGQADDWFALWRPSTAPYRTPRNWPEYPTLIWQAMTE